LRALQADASAEWSGRVVTSEEAVASREVVEPSRLVRAERRRGAPPRSARTSARTLPARAA